MGDLWVIRGVIMMTCSTLLFHVICPGPGRVSLSLSLWLSIYKHDHYLYIYTHLSSTYHPVHLAYIHSLTTTIIHCNAPTLHDIPLSRTNDDYRQRTERRNTSHLDHPRHASTSGSSCLGSCITTWRLYVYAQFSPNR